MKNYKYLLFDLDGTLTEPEEGITKCIQYALSKIGIHEPDRKKLCRFIGPPLIPAFCECYGIDEEKSRQALLYYRERFLDKGMYENQVYPGIKELLQDLKKQGKTIFLATSKPEPQAVAILKHFGLFSYFDGIAGSDIHETIVEKPDVIAYALQQIPAASKEEICMIGDRKYDVFGAKANGIACIGVLYGHGSREELEQEGAEVFAESVSELRALLIGE